MADYKVEIGASVNLDGAEKQVDSFLKKKRTLNIDTDDTVKNVDDVANSVVTAQKKTKSFGGILKQAFGIGTSAAVAVRAVREIGKASSEAVKNVKVLDKSMTELRKVTDETPQGYNKILKDASSTAKEIGTSIHGLIDSTADFARLGYNVGDAQKLAKTANIYAVIGSEISGIGDATQNIVSTMEAFDVDASKSMSIVDKFYKVGNEFAISSGGIGDALQHSASSMAAAGNSLDQTVALITAANTVVQNPEAVGTAFKTISMRIRGAKTELESAGLDTDNMAESVSKLRDEIQGLAGVDIMQDESTFKSTYQILDELSAKWKDLTDIQQASVTELLAGKRQGDIVSSLMNNFDTARKALDASLNADGSAMAGHAKYLDSIEAKTQQLSAAFESLSVNTINSDVVGGITQATTELVKFLDKTNLVKAGLTGLVGFGTVKGFTSIATGIVNAAVAMDKFNSAIKLSRTENIGKSQLDQLIQTTNVLSASQLKTVLSSKALTTEQRIAVLTARGMSASEAEAALATMGLSTAEGTATATTLSLKGAFMGLWATMKPFAPLIVGAAAAFAGFKAIEYLVTAGERATEAMDNAVSAYKQDTSDLESLNSQIKETQNSIVELQSKGGLTLVEKGQLEELRQTTRELQLQKDLLEKTTAADARDAAAKVTDAVRKNYSNMPTSNTEIEKQRFINEGYAWGATPLAGNVSSQMAYLQHLKDLQADTEYGGDIWKNYQSDIDNTTATIWNAVSAWEGYKSTLESLPESALSDRDKETLEILSASIETIYKDLDPAKWGQMKLDDFLSLDAVSKEKEKLIELAKKDKYQGISVEDLSREFLDSARKSGLADALGADYAQILVDAINSEAGAINVPAIKKSIHEKYGQTPNTQRAYDWVENLSNEDTEVVYKLSLDADSATWTLNQWMRKLAEYKQSSARFLDDLQSNASRTADVVSGINDANKLLNASNDGQSISLTAEELQKYGDALEYVDGAYRLNYESVKKLNTENTNKQIAANTEEMQKCANQYLVNQLAIAKYKRELENASALSEKDIQTRNQQIEKLQRENQEIGGVYNQYQYLNTILEESTGAYQRWLDAQSAASAGDYGENIGKAFSQIQSVVNKGKGWGTTAFKASVELMLPEDVSSEDQEAIAKWKTKIQKYFKQDGSLNEDSFLSDLFTKGLADHNWEDGTWSLKDGLHLSDIAKEFDMSSEAVKGFFDQLEASYGMKFDWLDELPQTFTDISSRAKECAESLDGIQFKDGREFKIGLNFDGNDSMEALERSLDSLMLLKTQARDGEIELDASQLESVNAMIQYCVAGLQQLNRPYIMSIDASGIDGPLGEALTLAQQLQEALDHYEIQVKSGGDIEGAKAGIDELVGKIGELPPEVTEEIGLNDLASDNLDAIQQKLDKISAGTTVTVNSADGTPTQQTIDTVVNDSAVAGYSPEDKTATVTYDVDSSAVDGYNPPNLSRTVTYTISTMGTPPGVGAAGVNGTAHVAGTAYAGGNWGTKQTETALVGEKKPEIMVDPATGRWQLIGQNGPEFRRIPKGSIIFNHVQTESLLKNGWAAGRGRSYAGGTAYISGTNKWPTHAGSMNWSGGNRQDTSGSASGGGSKSDKIDWPEIALKRIETLISRLNNIVSSSFKKVETKLSASNDAIENTIKQVDMEQKAYNTYMREANSVGLAESLAVQVREGNVHHIGSYDEDDTKKIEEYRKYYEQAISAAEKVDELHEALAELYKGQFDSRQKDYENQIGVIESIAKRTDSEISKIQAQGYMVTSQYYETQKQEQESTINLLKKQLSSMQDSFQKAMDSGEIDEDSDAYYEMADAIEDVKSKISDAELEIINLNNSLRELDWNAFDMMLDRIGMVNDEAELLLDFLDDAKLYDETGTMTDNGLAALGLRMQRYNTFLAESEKYAKEIQAIEEEIAKDPYNEKLMDRKKKLLDAQKSSIQASIDEKNAIQDLIQDGIDSEIDHLNDLVSAYEDALDSEKDLYSFSKKLKDQTSEIASIRKQIAAYENNTFAETKAKLQKLQVELTKAEDDLQETQYDKYVSDQKKLLSDMVDDYQKTLNERMDDVDGLITELTGSVNANSGKIYETIKEISAKYGYQTSDELNGIWASDGKVITGYGEKVSGSLTAIDTVVSTIGKDIAVMIQQLNALAGTNLSAAHSYASGKRRIPASEFAWTQENGIKEAIIRASDGALLTKLNAGDTVFSGDATKNLWDMANNPGEFLYAHLAKTHTPTVSLAGGTSINSTVNLDNVSFVLPNVKNYEEFLTAFQNDKKFERIVQAMTIDRIAGKSYFSKYNA